MKACRFGALAGIVLSAWLWGIGPAGAADDPAGRVVAELVKAYGGADAVGRVRSVMARGRINNVMRGGEGSYARYLERPGRLRIEIMPEQGGEVRVLADGRGWQGDVKQLHRARPVTVQAMVYQLSYLDLPMSLTDKSVPVFYGGSRVLEGQTFDLLELTPAGGSRGVRVYVDKESRLIVRVAADFDMGMGASELSTRYEDFRKVDGVLFPFRLINYAGDMTLSVITITDLKINDPLAPGLFSGGEGN